MYCKNCGNQLPEGAVACTSCGFAVGTGTSYCANCGVQVAPGQAVCVACGAPLTAPNTPAPAVAPQPRSRTVAALLAFFLGLGIYNFYLGYTNKAIIQLVLSLTVCLAPVTAVWSLVDFIRLLTGNLTVDGTGAPLKEYINPQQ